MTNKVAFIMGIGHSGSTLLDLILSSHPSAFSLGEFWYFAEKMEAGEGICSLCKTHCPFWNQKVSLSLLQKYFKWSTNKNKLLFSAYSYFGSFRSNIYKHLFDCSGAKLLVDSSKKIHWIRRQLRPFWHWHSVQPFLIYVCRDGRAVVNSYLRKYPNDNIAVVARNWAKRVLLMERYFESFSPEKRIKIAYEKLVTDPESAVRNLCRVLDVSYDPNMLRYWEHEHHPVNGNKGTYSLVMKFRNKKREQKDQKIDVGLKPSFYDHLGLQIELDLRWKQELSNDQLEIFESIAGNVNQAYIFNG